jgi:hypothetical protein
MDRMKCEIMEGIPPSMDESTANTLKFSFSLKDPKLMNKSRFEVVSSLYLVTSLRRSR